MLPILNSSISSSNGSSHPLLNTTSDSLFPTGTVTNSTPRQIIPILAALPGAITGLITTAYISAAINNPKHAGKHLIGAASYIAIETLILLGLTVGRTADLDRETADLTAKISAGAYALGALVTPAAIFLAKLSNAPMFKREYNKPATTSNKSHPDIEKQLIS